ncbi:MAG TPA: xanthine dehydrogenase family protein molybdopterin-binding subunit [Dehalococcoidia bacterium]|nr:xanthine dehydrogenase family protein molybdopterin-binding subunit [Dehalococcoidia bacterium]
MARETTIRPPTDANGHHAVGQRVTRLEGPAKVTGRTVYADDMKLPGMVHAKVLYAPYAHALIKSMDTAAAEALSGVHSVITAMDLPEYARNDSNRRNLIFPDKEVLFYGQPLAAVLAEDPHVAEEAVGLIDVAYEVLPAVIDPVAAIEPGSPLVREPLGDVDRSEERGHVSVQSEETEQTDDRPTNIASTAPFRRGDVDASFAAADVIVENTWRSSMTHQSYIEPHSTIASYDVSGELNVWTSTQAPFYIRDELAMAFGILENRIRVTATEVGGGFGGKIYLHELLTAALAIKVQRPVKYIMSRKDDMLAATPAPFAHIELKTGMKKDGTLTALQAKLIYDSGAFPGASVLAGCILIGGYYKCDNLDIMGYEVLTNKVSVGALRAPAAHNATFAIERHMDIMARELGLDPLEVRLKNAVEEGDPMPNGQPYPRIGLRECLEAAADSRLWRDRREIESKSNRGVGIAVGGWLGGLQPASAIAALNKDGTVNITVGSADITGTNTSFQQIAAEVLNLPLDRVNVTYGDTRTAPYAGMSAGSKTLYTVGRAVKLACEDMRDQMFDLAKQRLEAEPEDMELANGQVQIKGAPDRAMTFARLGYLSTNFGAPFPAVVGRGAITARKNAPGFTAQIADVEVDPDTGDVTLHGFTIAQDVGFAINPLSVEGQMQGGASQGIGLALWEEMLYDEEGRLLNPNLLDYRLPTSRDLPPIETIIVEVPSEEGPFGARIVGEPSIVAGIAAIGNAIENAVGARVTESPFTPERIVRTLGKL